MWRRINMDKSSQILAILGAAVIVTFSVTSLSYCGFHDSSISMENSATAKYRNNQNNYDSFWKGIQEVAQVPDHLKDAFKELLVADNTSTFGAKGSTATMQWFQNRGVHLSETTYLRLMNMIEAGRADFKRGQMELLDIQRKYHDHLESISGSMWGSSFPRTLRGEFAPPRDLDGDGRLTVFDYPIVTSAKTTEVFRTGQDDAIQVFPK